MFIIYSAAGAFQSLSEVLTKNATAGGAEVFYLFFSFLNKASRVGSEFLTHLGGTQTFRALQREHLPLFFCSHSFCSAR